MDGWTKNPANNKCYQRSPGLDTYSGALNGCWMRSKSTLATVPGSAADDADAIALNEFLRVFAGGK